MSSVTSVLHQYRLQPPTTGGILLNPSPIRHPLPLRAPPYPSRSNHSLTSSTSSSEEVNTPPSSVQATPPHSLSNSLSLPYTSDDDHVLRPRSGSTPDYGTSGSRHIRFAPLPDPRRAVLVTEHGEELPLPSVFDDDGPNSIGCPNLRSLHTSHTSSLLLGDGVVTHKELPTVVTPDASSPPTQSIRPPVSYPSSIHRHLTDSPTSSTATVTPANPCQSAPSARFAKRLLLPFRQKVDCSRRSGSRDSSSSRDDASPSWGIPLGHWASADTGSRTSSTNGVPLARAQSATSGRPLNTKRLLNGRIYGARKHPHHNVFDNAPDDEPEFVEWGHGGMGSVRAGGIWAKVQSEQKLLIGHIEERGRRGAPQSPVTDDDNDGSGMGWVKKRREARERKKHEEQAARESANKADAGSAPSPVSAPAPAATHDSTHTSVDHNITTITPILPRSADNDGDDDDDEDEEVNDDLVDDESSGTEQEEDEAAQVLTFCLSYGANN
jgi:hypothetical protein